MLPTNGVQRPRILFVDDEQRILTTMRMLFRNSYDVLLANNGQEALDALKQHEVDVVVSDQRMPGMTGIEVLRSARELKPRAMRILLTGYSDLNAIIGSINEGEIFRFVSKPWGNNELRETLQQAVEAAQIDLPPPAAGAEAPPPAASRHDDGRPDPIGVLIYDRDAETRELLEKALNATCPVYVADSSEACLNMLEQHPIGVIVAAAEVDGAPITSLLGALKQHHPHLVSIVVTDRADASQAIDLINLGQIYRFLLKPLREGMCKVNILSALRHNAVLLHNPVATKRFAVEVKIAPAAMEESGLMARIRKLRAMTGLGQ